MGSESVTRLLEDDSSVFLGFVLFALVPLATRASCADRRVKSDAEVSALVFSVEPVELSLGNRESVDVVPSTNVSLKVATQISASIPTHASSDFASSATPPPPLRDCLLIRTSCPSPPTAPEIAEAHPPTIPGRKKASAPG